MQSMPWMYSTYFKGWAEGVEILTAVAKGPLSRHNRYYCLEPWATETGRTLRRSATQGIV
jgi:hypothetical protein